jgi:uncharacterized protein
MKKQMLFFAFTMMVIQIRAQDADSLWFVNNYTKKEQYISMRDGIRLFTSIYMPRDTKEQHPFLMTRTPYSCRPYGEGKFAEIWKSYRMAYAKAQYIFVFQDVRGRYMSEGDFQDVRPFNKNKKGKTEIDEASDSYDAIDWLVKNIPNNNGRVGVIGTSYPGFYATEAALSNHPALKAVSPQAPVTDWFIGDDFHHNGAFFAMDGFAFYSQFGKPHPKPTMEYGEGFTTAIKDNYTFFLEQGTPKNLARLIGDSIAFWHEMMQHPDYDAWWQARNARNGLYNVKPAMLWVGGLFDAEDCWGAWNSYKACEIQSPQTDSRIVMGPWYHGQWSQEGSFLGNIRFGSNTSLWYQEKIEIPFFQYHLNGKGTLKDLAEAHIFFTGSNEWKSMATWPAKNTQVQLIYPGPNQSLIMDNLQPQKSSTELSQPVKKYIFLSDPAHPVPYTEDIHEWRTTTYMTDDQRFASRRPDVLTFTLPELKEDLSVGGTVTANLRVSISGTDADFVVKIIDEFPADFSYPDSLKSNGKPYPMGGYQMLVRGEIMRGKYRNSFSKPEPFVPNEETNVKFDLPDIAHTFLKGHKIVIQVQASWFPLADRNPQKFTNIYLANPEDYQLAIINLFYGNKNQTSFSIPVIK